METPIIITCGSDAGGNHTAPEETYVEEDGGCSESSIPDNSGCSATDQGITVSLINLDPAPLMCVPVTIVTNTVDALLDTGATFSLMKESLVLPESIFSEGDLRSVTGLGGISVAPLGRVDLSFRLGLVNLSTQFLVIPDHLMKYKLILGNNFFSQYKAVVKMSSNCITGQISHSDFEVYFNDSGSHSIFRNVPVYAQQDVSIEGYDPVLVPVAIDSMVAESGGCHDYYFDGGIHSSDSSFQYIQGEEGVVSFADGQAEILMIKLPTGTRRKDRVRFNQVVGFISTIVDLPALECEVNLAETRRDSDHSTIIEEINLDCLNSSQTDAVKSMLSETAEVFSTSELDVGCAGVTQHKIELLDETPIRQCPRRFPEPVNDALEQQFEELRQMNVLKYSKSPWSSPIVPVRKKDGSLRMCIDYRALNKVTKADRFPIPNMNDLIFGLHGMQYFTTLDLKKGYYQVPLEPESMEYTAFSTATNHYEFCRLPFGLKNAPGAFQREMQEVLREFNRKQVVVYIDDILIMSHSFEEHLSLVSEVLGTLIQYGIKVSAPKCFWFCEEVDFLGHVVGRRGLRKSDKYMNTVREYPRPTTVKQLRSFLGLINFQRKFIPHCSTISKPLSALTGLPDKHVLEWSEEMTTSFETLKSLIAEQIELAYPDYSSEHRLELSTDASAFGSGACLSQTQDGEVRLIAYASMSFNAAQRAYSTIERELAAIRWAVHTFRSFLYGIPFCLYTDHRPLVYMSNMSRHNACIMRTLNELGEFDFEIRYRIGKDNHLADALSRLYPDEYQEPVTSSGLPKGIQLLKEVKGGGDSLIESLLEAFNYHKGVYDPAFDLPSSVEAVREALVVELLAHPAKYSLIVNKTLRNRLKLLKLPGQVVDLEFLPALCACYQLEIWVHTDAGLPIIYTIPGSSWGESTIEQRVHVQSISGVHYNPLFETPLYKPPIVVDAPDSQDFLISHVEEPLQLDVLYAHNSAPSLACRDRHSSSTAVKTVVYIDGNAYCAVIDTGAQVSVISDFVYESLSSTDYVAASGGIEIVGIGASARALGIVELDFGLAAPGNKVSGTFAVMNGALMPFCIIIGADLIRPLDLQLNFRKFSYQFTLGESTHTHSFLSSGDTHASCSALCLTQDAVVINNGVESHLANLLSELQVKIVQRNNLAIRKLYQHVLHKDPPKEWKSPGLHSFKRFSSDFRVLHDVLWYWNGSQLTPVVSHPVLVEVALQIHWQMSHLGRNKLIQSLLNSLWHPSINAVSADITNSCPVCQKFKTNIQQHAPPVVRIESSSPFDLIAVDLLQLPKTSRGHIGCLVVVDHFSKWLLCLPIRNKRSDTIADLFEHRVLPSLLAKPNRLLSDNGKEFTAEAFASVLDKFGIHHIRSTPYMPSSNGAVERVNRSVGEMLRCVSEEPALWDEHLSQVLVTYNNSCHSSLGMSPSQCLLKHAHASPPVPLVSSQSKHCWKEGHPSFAPFRKGNKVLLKVQRPGHDTRNKFLPRFSGPYAVKKAHEGGLAYELLSRTNSGFDGVIKAHHSQLRKWIEPPKYIKQHPTFNELLQDNAHCVPEEDGSDVDIHCDSVSDGEADFSGFEGSSLPVRSDDALTNAFTTGLSSDASGEDNLGPLPISVAKRDLLLMTLLIYLWNLWLSLVLQE